MCTDKESLFKQTQSPQMVTKAEIGEQTLHRSEVSTAALRDLDSGGAEMGGDADGVCLALRLQSPSGEMFCPRGTSPAMAFCRHGVTYPTARTCHWISSFSHRFKDVSLAFMARKWAGALSSSLSCFPTNWSTTICKPLYPGQSLL